MTALQRQALDLLDALLDLEPEARDRRLAELARTLPALHDEVAALLAADAGAGVLERRPASLLAAYAPERGDCADDALGQRIGPWRITGVVGRGGMGAVYRAERSDGEFGQEAAVKLIRMGLDRPELRRRFLRERQILARLRHPHIATLLDGGVTATGAPYYAMELVNGEPIDRWCDARALDLRARVRLFLQVCAAVQHAHQNLVVHRDLKPGNVLVDGEGRVRLLDFGIAKLLDDGGQGETATRERPFTPEYAAPEQLRGEPVTTATDVYAMGAMLYVLLAGTPPSGRHGGLSPAALLAPDVAPLSRAAERSGPGAARARGYPHARALARALRGDIDAVVQRCLQVEPTARYPSVASLAAELQAWLEGRPVGALRGQRLYRMRKFAIRHRGGVATAVAVAVVLAAGTGYFTSRLAAERDRALGEAARAEQVGEFLVQLFSVSDPAVNRGERLTARDLLERGARRMDENELAAQPALQAALAGLIGEIHLNLGEYDRAEPLLDRALALASGLDDRPMRVRLLRVRGLLEHRRGDYRAALGWNDRAQALLDDTSEPAALAGLLNNRALAEKNLGDYDAAERTHRRALRLFEDALGPDAIELGPTLNNLALLLWKSMGRAEEARPLFERALRLYERHHGEMHPLTSGTLMNLGWLLSEAGEFDAAEPLLTRNLAIEARLQGEDSVAYATALLTFGNFQSDRGRRGEAIELYHRAHAIYLRHLGPAHDYLAYPLRNLGLRHAEAGDHARALAHFDDALAVLREALPENHPRIAIVQHLRGRSLAASGRFGQARTAYAEALRIREARLPTDSAETRETRLELLLADAALDGAASLATDAAALLAAYPADDPARSVAAERLLASGVRAALPAPPR